MYAKVDYLGKKGASGIAQFIISKMPKHEVYIESFLGTGYIMANKKPAKINIGIDKDISILQMTNFTNDYILYCGDSLIFLKYLIDNHIYDGSICVYLDPPYLPETRTSFTTCKYPNELTFNQHGQLLQTLKDISMVHKNVYFLLSGYASELYSTMLQGWYKFETQTMSRGGVRTECLWTSFNPNDFIKHDYNYVGHNFTDRQRIKRKAKRWVDGLNKLPLDERMFIFEMISHSKIELCSSINSNSLLIKNDLQNKKINNKNVSPLAGLTRGSKWDI